MQRAAILAGGDFLIGFFGLGEREVACERDDAMKLRVELLNALQINVGEALGGELALLDPA